MKLHFGVIDLPYAWGNGGAVVRGKRRRARGNSRSVTTGQVATWLENKYHIMQAFYESRPEFVIGTLTQSVTEQMENVMLGAPVDASPFEAGAGIIEDRFKQFLSTREVETLGIPGVPTQAAIKGLSQRFKKRNAGRRRPSFIDTGLYQSSFKVWVD